MIYNVCNAAGPSCDETKFPKLLGGQNGNTFLTAMDVDQNYNIVVGGKSNDSSILNTASSPEYCECTLYDYRPLVMYYNAEGGFVWGKHFPDMYGRDSI